ncbi:MAG: nucleotidyltransferase family protein [Rhodospirillales bacterium]|nr:nucleotidyltransferase family protein [Rhodospirillales bacterium]
MTAAPHVAMVLAAGLGKRMRPLTETLPKPLIPVAGRTLIDRVLDRFAEIGIERAVVNLHHHRGQLEAHLKQRAEQEKPPLVLSPETELLETGGGVVHALPALGDAPFYVANADVLWLDGYTPALLRLARAWDETKMDALLLLQRSATAFGYEGRGDYFLDPLGRVRRRASHEVAPFVFAGVQILHPRLFKDAPTGAFSLNRIWDRAEAAERLWGVAHDGLWYHVGTPADVAATEAELGHFRRPRGGG